MVRLIVKDLNYGASDMPHDIGLPHNMDLLHHIFMDLTGVDGKKRLGY
jgi:hypothetical protein